MAQPYLTREQLREIDRQAIEDWRLPGAVLMENAGRGCAELLLQKGFRGPVAICCGKGNNGGDGAVIARHLDNRGVPVQVLLAGRPDELRGDAALHFGVIQRSELPIQVLPEAGDWTAAQSALGAAEWIVDALLGTGFQGTPREPAAAAIRAMNAAGRPILAVDLPSGLDAETGQVSGECVRATETATFVALKTGFESPVAQQRTGRIAVLDIGLPRRLLTTFGIHQELP